MKNPFHAISRNGLRVLGTLFLAASLGSEQAIANTNEESFELPHTTDQEEQVQRRREFEDMQEGKLGIRDFSGPGLRAAYYIPASASHPAVTLRLPAKLSI